MGKSTMIYTPKRRIPIEEATKDHGVCVLRIKKSKSGETDTIQIEELIKQVIQKSENAPESDRSQPMA